MKYSSLSLDPIRLGRDFFDSKSNSHFQEGGACWGFDLDEERRVWGEETAWERGAAGGVAGAFVEGGAVGGEDSVGGAGSGALEGDEVGALADEARCRDVGGG